MHLLYCTILYFYYYYYSSPSHSIAMEQCSSVGSPSPWSATERVVHKQILFILNDVHQGRWVGLGGPRIWPPLRRSPQTLTRRWKLLWDEASFYTFEASTWFKYHTYPVGPRLLSPSEKASCIMAAFASGLLHAWKPPQFCCNDHSNYWDRFSTFFRHISRNYFRTKCIPCAGFEPWIRANDIRTCILGPGKPRSVPSDLSSWVG